MEHKTTTVTDMNLTGEPKDQRPMITGRKYFILSPGQTFKLKEDIITNMFQQISGLKELIVEECDVILVFCVIVSRAGTDINAALNELNALSESKPAVFMVLHHTFDSDKIVPDSSSYVSRKNTLTVDCLFNEDKGFLNCVKNDDALIRIKQWLQPQQHTQDKKKICTYDENYLIVESELILVLLGMSVLEKTAVEHMIFGRKESLCDASPAPLMKITVDTEVVDGEQVTVINTPDWFNSGLSPEEIKQKIKFCIGLSSHRPYALLLVIPVNQFFQKQKEMVQKFKIFQNTFCKRLMVLFTATNEQEEQEIQKHDLKPLTDKCENDFHVLNISQIEKRSQVSELLKKVENIVKGNEESNDVRKMSETQIKEAIARSKQVSVEEVNYIKVSLLEGTFWIAEKTNESYMIIDYL